MVMEKVKYDKLNGKKHIWLVLPSGKLVSSVGGGGREKTEFCCDPIKMAGLSQNAL